MRRLVPLLAALALIGCGRGDPPPSRAIVIAAAVASSVQLFTLRDQARRAGSAVVLAVDEQTGRPLLLTSAHLLTPLVEQEVRMAVRGGGEPMPATLLALDQETDLALLEVSATGLRPAAMQPMAKLGDGVWVIAFPWGRERTLVQGVVSQIDEEDLDVSRAHASAPIEGPVRLIDASVSYGMSGGGVFDAASGRLVGIVRGYRSAQLRIPGGAPLSLPVAGETTVVPAPAILCFLVAQGYVDRIDLLPPSQGGGCAAGGSS